MKKIGFMLMIALVLLLAACTEENTETDTEKETVTPVEVDQVTKDNLVIEKSFYGRTAPNATTPIIPSSPGEIESVEVSKGDQIEEEDVIATMTSAQYGTVDIEAPADGEIVSLDIEEGSMVSNQNPIATIVDLDTVNIQVNVPVNYLTLFQDNEEATAIFSSIDLEATADIDYLSSVANDTGLYTIELSLSNEDKKIKPGMVAKITVPEKVISDALIIPTTALVEEADESFVYVVSDDVVEKRLVTVLEAQTDFTAIEGELAEGDTVVTSGQLTLSDGNQVTIMKEEE
ncbi:efflux RND transporter periplasmic adaptor subunit [Aquibacillus koreensis]|uniref:Efflux RND transporter periplasmic adaptor subunit n=1 Tax=Aquibacillus koreensis TaxID=279446 RepID=A0A9X4AH99_9BACI|nr:efflux RND transporter periplasmic adaptor subunit [Aquibacillus koreensis]MCT2535113.1 efflux RND transporter periplasmic adaptor subunit [Aquibacillus koreensis]MDC3419756.1 efflux RND transporter periplasmic adaptor subunit [Aquibacillus koreensis]